MQQLKMRLRLVINAILDQKIHAGNMSEQEAMALMMNEGYQEDGEAAGKWRRAQLTSTQLSTYYVGNLEVNALAQDLQRKTGGDIQGEQDDGRQEPARTLCMPQRKPGSAQVSLADAPENEKQLLHAASS